MPVATFTTSDRHVTSLTSSLSPGRARSSRRRSGYENMGRESLVLTAAKRSYGLEQVRLTKPAGVGPANLLSTRLRSQHVSSAHCRVIAQIVQAVEGATVGLRDQLEALTILDETALTWPGLSLVCG